MARPRTDTAGLEGGLHEAGIPLPDHRTPVAQVDDLPTRLRDLRVDPTILGADTGQAGAN